MNYQTGQSVIYRNKGVYTIESIGKVAFLPDSEKIYYTLRPVFRSGDEHIYVPTVFYQKEKRTGNLFGAGGKRIYAQ